MSWNNVKNVWRTFFFSWKKILVNNLYHWKENLSDFQKI